MNTKSVVSTAAAILMLGLTFATGARADRGGGDENQGKGRDKDRQEQRQAQRQYQPQGRPQRPATQDPQQRPTDRDWQHRPEMARERWQEPSRHQQWRQPQPQQEQWQQQRQQQWQQPRQQQWQQPWQQSRQQQWQQPRQQPWQQSRQQQWRQPQEDHGRYRRTTEGRPITPLMSQERNTPFRVQQRALWPRYRAQDWRTQHMTWSERGGYRGYRIPSTQFGMYFGRPHMFHLSSFEVRTYDDYPQFFAEGIWFTMLDPVPEYWADDWYVTDYVYVVSMPDGYYLVDDEYPDDMIALSCDRQ